MKSIGKYLKDTRLSLGIKYEDLERKTKIKKEFLKAIETESWAKLPEFPVVLGFVKSIADSLEVDRSQAAAFLRRDYPPQKLLINPKPDVFSSFKWSPRLTFFVGLFLVAIVVTGYLGFQYYNFVRPPKLEITSPQEGEIVTQSPITVSGETDLDATIRINNQPALVLEDGKFTSEIEVFDGTEEIVVKATSRSGKESTISRKIVPELK